jgi:predicted type IV restriction endonuclease
MALVDALRPVAERAARYRAQKLGEQNTKATLIDPVIRELGWNVEDVEEVQREYRHRSRDKPVDYALLVLGVPSLFIEAKGLGENLGDRRWASQVVSYASVAGVAWVVLTDGDEYRIYNAHAPVDVDEKLFRTVRLSEDVERAADTLELLSKGQLRGHTLEALWRAQAAERKLKHTVESFFSPEPARWLVSRLARSIEGLSESEIRGALARAHVDLTFTPAQTEARARDAAPAADGSSSKQPAKRRDAKTAAGARQSRPDLKVSLADLLRAGVIEAPLELTRTYLGRQLTARIEADGRVECQGQLFDSVSMAAGVARASLRGAPAGRRYLPTNGWTFWRFQDEDGQLVELEMLRKRYIAGRVQDIDVYRRQRSQ